MTKMQKIWLGIFLAMFIVPEVLLGGLLSTYFNLRSVFDTSSVFVDSPILGYLNFVAEIVGVFGLLFISRQYKYKNRILKHSTTIFLVFILISQLLIAYAYFSFRFVSFP